MAFPNFQRRHTYSNQFGTSSLKSQTHHKPHQYPNHLFLPAATLDSSLKPRPIEDNQLGQPELYNGSPPHPRSQSPNHQQ